MSTYTPNYNLEKPDDGDDYQSFRSSYNDNMDIIDQNLGGGGGGSSVSWQQLQVTGDKIATIRISGIDTSVYSPNSQTFTMAVSRANINSGETYSTIFGKIKKWFNDLKTVAFSGSYNDLSDQPTIPTDTSDLNNDSDFVSDASYVHTDNNFTNADVTKLSGIQSGAEVNVQSDWNEADNTADAYIANKPSLATVATSGSYADLSNKPTIPDELADLADDSTHRVVTDTQISTWNGKSDFSGSYNDLTDKPTIPTVNDGTLTIQQNGTTVGTFTANQSGNTTVNLSGGGGSAHTIVNESGTSLADEPNLQFTDGLKATDDSVNSKTVVGVNTTFTEAVTRTNIASGESFATILGKIKKFFNDLKAVAFSGSYNDLSDKPTIPSAQVNSDWNANSGVAQILNKPSLATVATSGKSSDLNNDAGFITSAGSCNYANSAGTATDNTKVAKTGDTMTGSLEIQGADLILDASNGSGNILQRQTSDQSYCYTNTLPAQDGTLALTSQIPTNNNQLANGAGYITNTLPIMRVDTDIPEGATNLSETATAHRVTAYRNGFSIPYQMNDTNDGGILRVRGTTESNCILELGTWDDSGAGETIQFNYYPTTSQVIPTHSVTVPKKSGTIALTSDIPTDNNQLTNGAGYITSAGSCVSAKFLKAEGWTGGFYENNDTHWLQLGYFVVTSIYSNHTLLVTSEFWGNQHGSAHIINIRFTGASGGIEWEASKIHLGGWDRPFTVWVDQTNYRIYLYVFVVGGNSYGTWEATDLNCNDGIAWTPQYVSNYSVLSWTAIDFGGQIYLSSRAIGDGNGNVILSNYGAFLTYDGITLTLNAKDGTQISNVNLNISSKRYKKNIKEFEEKEARKILDVRTVTYDFKEQRWGRDRYTFDQHGVIAEEIEQIIPTAVRVKDINGKEIVDSVDYCEFVPYLIKMVQIQQKEIEELKAMIKEK